MCGLCGVFGLVGPEERKAFSYLQCFSQLRGRDSTGLAVISYTRNAPIQLFKELGGVETLVLDNPDVFDPNNWQVKAAVGGLCFIGHHRYCTSGAITAANAHPFDLDNIVGCHNGTLSEYSIKDLPSYDKDLIDSQIILKEIDSGRVLKEIVEDIRGVWALVWWDKVSQTLNMCRNKERALYIAMVSEGRSLFWASESWMLDVALRRAGFTKDKFDILETTPNKHLIWGRNTKYKIELKDSLDAEAKDDIDWDPWVYGQERIEKERAKVIDIRQNKRGKGRSKVQNYPKYGRDKVQIGHQEEFTEVYAKAFDGMYIMKIEYEYLTKRGCSWCSDTDSVSWERRDSVSWYAEDHPVCEVCDNGNNAEAAARKVH